MATGILKARLPRQRPAASSNSEARVASPEARGEALRAAPPMPAMTPEQEKEERVRLAREKVQAQSAQMLRAVENKCATVIEASLRRHLSQRKVKQRRSERQLKVEAERAHTPGLAEPAGLADAAGTAAGAPVAPPTSPPPPAPHAPSDTSGAKPTAPTADASLLEA